jgi:hypothetical protein
MLINPIVAEVYYNQSTNTVSGLSGILHNIYGHPMSYFYITIEVSKELKITNSSNSDSCIDIIVNDKTYTIICEIDNELMDCNINDDMVISNGFNHNYGDKLYFDHNYVGIPVEVWTLINGMLLTPKI